MAELGAGGGKGDLDQQHELEVGDAGALGMLMSLCATKMQNQPKLLSNVMEMLASIMRDPVRVIALDSAAVHSEQRVYNQDDFAELEHMPLDSLVPILASLAAKRRERKDGDAMSLFTEQEANATEPSAALPTQIVSAYPSSPTFTSLTTHADLPLLPPLLIHRALPAY
jgi:DNA cross-link repair 1C protein